MKPPPGWFNVPIQSDDVRYSGCQMMRAGAKEELRDILRVLSLRLPPAKKVDPPWYAVMISFEKGLIGLLGYKLGNVVWKRDSVKMSGSGLLGLKNARAIGFETSVGGSKVPQEAHFLLFEDTDTKYTVTLLTPAKDVETGIDYKRNSGDFGILIRSFNRKH